MGGSESLSNWMGLAMHMWGGGGQPRQVIKEGTSELLVKLTQKLEEEEQLQDIYKMVRVFSFPFF